MEKVRYAGSSTAPGEHITTKLEIVTTGGVARLELPIASDGSEYPANRERYHQTLRELVEALGEYAASEPELNPYRTGTTP